MRIVDHREVRRALAEHAQIAEILPLSEYRRAHIRGAIHLPLSQVLHDVERRMEKVRPTIVYCRDSL